MAHLQRLAPVLVAVGSPSGPSVVCQQDVNEIDNCGFACGIPSGFIAGNIACDLEVYNECHIRASLLNKLSRCRLA